MPAPGKRAAADNASPVERAFDLAVVGSGSAGIAAATAVRAAGGSVAVIDARPFGGTCALRGCDPKKVLVAAARVVDDAERLVQLGILDRAPVLQWPQLMCFKRTFTDPVPVERERMLREAGIEAIHGAARFVDPQTLQVNGERIRAQNVVIAAGATPQHVARGDDALLTSEQFLDLECLPGSLVLVGGGYIAFEFAHLAARAGARVTILHNDAHPLSGFEPEIVAQLVDATRQAGIDVRLDTPARAVERADSGIVVHAEHAGRPLEIRAEQGVLAAGRVPDLDALALDAGGIEREKRGVTVNEFLQSVSNPRVYAAGDCAAGGGLPLTPVAARDGEIVAENILSGNARRADVHAVATMVYAMPPLGMVGMTQAQAQQRGIEVETSGGDMTQWYSSRHVAARVACYKVVREKKTGTLLGATVLGPHAEDQINTLALAMAQEIDSAALARTLFAYPTGSSDIEYFFGGT